jgi:hypothetical protein
MNTTMLYVRPISSLTSTYGKTIIDLERILERNPPLQIYIGFVKCKKSVQDHSLFYPAVVLESRGSHWR